MKYILMMNTMPAGSEGLDWPKTALQNHISYMMEMNKELTACGELADAQGLAFPDQAKIVRAGKTGEPVTDGVFPESKEFLAGFWIVDVDSLDRACAIAAKASAAPGPDGTPLNMPIEVRQMMSEPPADLV
jgi:hypothetical protein